MNSFIVSAQLHLDGHTPVKQWWLTSRKTFARLLSLVFVDSENLSMHSTMGRHVISITEISLYVKFH